MKERKGNNMGDKFDKIDFNKLKEKDNRWIALGIVVVVVIIILLIGSSFRTGTVESSPERDASIKRATDMVEESFSGFGEVAYNKDSHSIDVMPESETFGAPLGLMRNGKMPSDDWDGIIEIFAEFSKEASDIVDRRLSLTFKDVYDDEYYLVVRNGRVVYDIVRD